MVRQKMPFQLRIRCRNRGDSTNGRQNASETKSSEKETSSSMTSKGSASTNWRHKMRAQNPEKYDEIQKAGASYNKLQRLEMALAERTLQKRNLSEGEKKKAEKYQERKKRCNATAAGRMRKMRAKRKAEAQHNPKSKQKVPLTRAQQLKERERKDRDAAKKRQERAAMSKEAHEQYLANRREKYRQKKEMEKMQNHEAQRLRAEKAELEKERMRLKELEETLHQEKCRLEQSQDELHTAGADVRRPAARRKSLQRARSNMPLEPVQFVSTTIDLIKKASPRKAAAFKKKGVDLQNAHQEVQKVVFTSISQQMKELRRSRKKKDLLKKRNFAKVLTLLKKYRLQTSGCRLMNIGPKVLTSIQSTNEKPHKRATTDQVKALVTGFFEEEAIYLPDKKLISKKTMKKTGFLQEPVSTLYSKFKAEHPDIKLGLKKFYSLRPKHIRLQQDIKYRACLCEYCTNIELKATAINKLAHSYGMKSFFQGVYGVNRVTLCPKLPGSKYYQRDCIQRTKCTKCGTKQLETHLGSLKARHGSKMMTWKKWEKVFVEVDGKRQPKQEITTKENTLGKCIEELKAESYNISRHLFNALWQNQQFSNITKNVPSGCVIMVLDFAENFVCKYQDEVQSAHWFHSNATIHPIVCYYRCPHCSQPMEESLVFITADRKHDYHAVHSFMTLSALYLSQKLNIDRIIRFSDQCGSQYKSKGPFLDVCISEEEYGIPIEHHYFGSRHGKGPSDGESAVIKRQASTAIASGTVINNAMDLYHFCTENTTKAPGNEHECLHFQRRVFLVEDIDHKRGHADVDIRTIKGTMLLHSVKGHATGRLWTRNLSCFCSGCTGSSPCHNQGYVDLWQGATLFTRPPSFPRHLCLGRRAGDRNAEHQDNHDAEPQSNHDAKPQDIHDAEPQNDHDAEPQNDHDAESQDHNDAEPQDHNVAEPQDHNDDEPQDSHDAELRDNQEDPGNDETDVQAEVKVHDFVAVRVASAGKKNSDEMHVAKVASVLADGNYSLSYMTKHRNLLYTWPEGDELFFQHPSSDIITKLEAPEPVLMGSRLLSKFKLTEAQKLFKGV